MPKLIILGSSNAVASASAENTHLLLVGNERIVLVDCVSTPCVRLERAGIEPNDITDVIITHFHPDHVSGLPLLLMDMWLTGRTAPLTIYGLDFTLDRVESLLELYSWKEWPNFFDVTFVRLPSVEGALVLRCAEFTIRSSPVQHMIPNIGLRFEFEQSGKVLAYSCDTEPCEQVVRLSSGADVLIHEASGGTFGHSSAKQAGEIAARAGVPRLYLIHYASGKHEHADLVHEAGSAFAGKVALARDLMMLDFSKRIPLSQLGRGVSLHRAAADYPAEAVEP